jgi:hypothetical protein
MFIMYNHESGAAGEVSVTGEGTSQYLSKLITLCWQQNLALLCFNMMVL